MALDIDTSKHLFVRQSHLGDFAPTTLDLTIINYMMLVMSHHRPICMK